VSKTVIGCALLLVREDFVGFIYLLELLAAAAIAMVMVGVMLEG